MPSRVSIFNKAYITIKNCKNLSFINCINYDKKDYYINTYIKFGKNCNTLEN